MAVIGKSRNLSKSAHPVLSIAVMAGILAAASGIASAQAAEAAPFRGAQLGVWWIIPFAGILASLAIFPLAAPHLWHRRYGLVSLFWALTFIIPFAARFGVAETTHELAHAILTEYVPFIVLIGALYTIAGGIHVGGDIPGKPGANTLLLLIGTALASIVGTTGASMILIRPLIRANRNRPRNAHVAVFFIFLVSNIGGALTPLGDPPLFLGYLQGVDFLWPLHNLWKMTVLLTALLLAVFFLIDSYFYRQDKAAGDVPPPKLALKIRGLINLPLIVLLIAAVVASGSYQSIGSLSVLGAAIPWANVMRDIALIVLALASLLLTPQIHRDNNVFTWGPVIEVAKIFASIFVTIIPAIAILKAGREGSLSPLIAMLGDTQTPNNIAYFWLTGGLSGFLDNAPTYLVFFNAAGGQASDLMGPLSPTLAAISAGAVFMGANSYIGNAPNFMVKAIAEEQGIQMPGFFGYMLRSGAILAPAFLLITLIFFR